MILPSSIDQVMHAADIVEVVGDFVQLKRSGTSMQGLCPFHSEKTPSFSVSPSRQIYKCFGCGEGGNAVNFLMSLEKMSYVEAIRYLADKYKITLEETEMTDEQKESMLEVESLGVVNTAAQKFFVEQLWETDEGKSIGLSYFRERGLSDDIIREWGLGYCPSKRDAFYTWAKENGYPEEILLKAGLIGESNGRYYDKYSDRVIFPIHSLTGKVIGFGARILDSTKKTAKYLNSPENELYHKSKVLYGLYLNKKKIVEKKQVLLTEGYMDVIGLSEYEICTAVASSGTSLTAEQARLIKKYSPTVTVLYDSDEAGLKASLRAIDICLAEGLDIKLVSLEKGEDPDSYVKKHGKQALEDYIQNNQKDFVDFTLDTLLAKDPQDLHKRNEATQTLAQSISQINQIENITLRADYIRKAAQRMTIEERALLNLVNKNQRENNRALSRKPYTETEETSTEEVKSVPTEPQSDHEKNEYAILKLLLKQPKHEVEEGLQVLAWLKELVEGGFILSPKVKQYIKEYAQLADNQPYTETDKLTNHSNPDIVKLTIDLLHTKHKLSPNWERYNISVTDEAEVEEENFEKSILYFQIRNIKKMQQIEMEKLKTETDPKIAQGIIQAIDVLKEEEQNLILQQGTIIYK